MEAARTDGKAPTFEVIFEIKMSDSIVRITHALFAEIHALMIFTRE